MPRRCMPCISSPARNITDMTEDVMLTAAMNLWRCFIVVTYRIQLTWPPCNASMSVA